MRWTSARRRLAWTLCAALALHAVVAALLTARRPQPAVDAKEVEVVVLADDESPAAPPPPSESTRESESRPDLGGAIAAIPMRKPGALREPTQDQAAPADSAEPAAEPSSEPAWSFQATRPTDLGVGVGSYWKSVAMGGDSPAPGTADVHRAEGPPPVDSAIATRLLRDGLAARDHDLGLDRSGALVSAAHDAASPNIAPEDGVATFEIDTDETGRVVAARVVSARDPQSWEPVARELVRLMASKRLRVPERARGLRSHLQIVAEQRMPSGNKVERAPGAVPDDVPGSDKVCEGTGASRRCTSGMPVGYTGHFDISNIGAKPSRVVSARLLDERPL